MKYDGQMDNECIEICDAINALNGIYTKESCCGHGKDVFMIFLKATDLRALFFLGRAISLRYGGPYPKWECFTGISDVSNIPTFRLESESKGIQAYKEARQIVRNIYTHVHHQNFIQKFNLEDIISGINHDEKR